MPATRGSKKDSDRAITPVVERRSPDKGALEMPEQEELGRKTGQRGLLIDSYKRLEKTL